MKKETIELTRHNITPAAFASYVRQQIKKHEFKTILAGDIDTAYWKAGNDLNCDIVYHDSEKDPVMHEKTVSRPYEMQVYVKNWDGTVYNMIMQFDFWDDKTGTGYFFFVNTWKDEEEAAADEANIEAAKEMITEKPVKKLSKEAAGDIVKADYTMLYKPMPAEIKAAFPVVTTDICSRYFGLHFTDKHDGKMNGMFSLSTTCKVNPECRARIQAAFRLVKPGFCIDTATKEEIKAARRALSDYIKKNPHSTDASICGFCFSDKQQDCRKNMVPCLSRNYEIMNNGIIHQDWLPVLNTLYFRMESFGDFSSVYAVANAVNLMRKNPYTFFGVWTKNPGYFHAVFNGDPAAKPGNCNIILSTQYINTAAAIPEKYRYFIDKTFSVFTAEHAAKNDIHINCGARSCLTCLQCYKKDTATEVNEELK